MTTPHGLVRSVMFLGLWGALLFPAGATAQQAGAIAGIVRDTTGGVLPGVTVEAASPALIEKVRTVVTDSQGNYKLVDLRPGVYSVTFTLPGFSVVKREGLELTTGFTANVNADLKVGSLEETVTVTGASPVVDIQNARQQTVLSRELLDNLPTNKSIQGFAALTLGATQSATAVGNQTDAGGSFGIHGGRAADSKTTMDGMQVASAGSTGNGSSFYNSGNPGAVQETVLQTSGITAEAASGGVQINVVPKDGGNTFSYYFNANGTGPKLASNNINDALRARGLTSTPGVKQVYDVGGAVGGPLRKDRLWFFGAVRKWDARSWVPGGSYNKNQGKYVGSPNVYFGNPVSGVSLYEPDLSRPSFGDIPNRDGSLRLTWQVSAKHKINLYNDVASTCGCNGANGNTAIEATTRTIHSPIYAHQVTWSYPATNRLLFEAGGTRTFEHSPTARQPEVSIYDIPINELSTGFKYNAKAPTATASSLSTNYSCTCKNFIQGNQRFAVSLITGSHAFKTGIYVQENWNHDSTTTNYPPVLYNLRNGVPQSIQEFAELEGIIEIMPDMGMFVQDQWTLHKITLNAGVRFNYYNAVVPAQHTEAKTFVQAFDAPAANGVPGWTDLDPRVGAAYDLFGNGKTAIKTSLGRYVGLYAVNALPRDNVPGRRITTSATRTWTDTNGNYVPDCILQNPEANGECGRASNVNIGKQAVATTFADDMLKGYGNRGYSWQGQVSLQHELRPGMALNAGYFRTWFGNFTVQTNRALTPADFDSYCITAPTDARLGSTSGQQLCGFHDVKPASFGVVDTLVTQAANFGSQTEVYNGVDIGMNARFGKGGVLQGGVSTGRTVTDICGVVQTSPQVAWTLTSGGVGATTTNDFCRNVNGMKGQTQFKVAGNYPLPWMGLQASAVYQNLPGIPISASQSITNAAIAPSLGRNLSAGSGANVSTALMIPFTQFENRLSQLDLRFTKVVRVGRARVQGQFDLYNVFNAGSIVSENGTFGPTWKQPTAVLGPRLLKFGAQFDF